MNTRKRENGRSSTRLLVLLAAFGMFSLAPQAATQYWDGAGVENDSIVTGGPGVWDSGATNWTTADGLTNSVWGQDEAVFSANAGAVIISGKVLDTAVELHHRRLCSCPSGQRVRPDVSR